MEQLSFTAIHGVIEERINQLLIEIQHFEADCNDNQKIINGLSNRVVELRLLQNKFSSMRN